MLHNFRRFKTLLAPCMALMAFQFVFITGAQNQGYTDGIVAVVNDDVITVFDVASYNADFERNIKNNINEQDLTNNEKRKKLFEEINANRIRAAHDLINEKLIYAEFLKKGYQFPTELVEKRIDSIVNSYTGGDWGQFEEMLIESNTSMAKFREKIERKLAVDLLLNQSLDRNIIISPSQVETYYDDNIDQYSEPTKVLLQVIMLNPDESKSKNEFTVLINDIKKKIKEGADFSDLASQYSHDPSRKNGGILGWLKEEDIRSEFKTALAKIEKGVVSDELSLNGVIYFVKVADIKEGVEQPVSDVYEQIKKKLYSTEKKERYETYIADLRSKAYVRVFFQE